MAFIVKFENGDESGFKIPIKFFELTDSKDCEWLHEKIVNKVYEFKIRIVDGNVGLIYIEESKWYVEESGLKKGWFVLFDIRNVEYILVSHFDEHVNSGNGFIMIAVEIQMSSCVAQTSKMSSLRQLLPKSFFEGYEFKKQTLYCVRTCDGWMRVYLDFDEDKPASFCGYEWKKFCEKQMIDGSQTFVVYFIVGHHFILTIHDACGFCQDPEFRHCAFWKNTHPWSLTSSDSRLKCPPFELGVSVEKVIKVEEGDCFVSDKIVEAENNFESIKRRKVPSRGNKRLKDCGSSSHINTGVSNKTVDDGCSFVKELGRTVTKGYITIPAGFVRKHRLYNYSGSDDTTKMRLCYVHSSFEKDLMLRKYSGKAKVKQFDDHVFMLGEWKHIMNEVGFVEKQAVKFTLDVGVLSSKGDIVLTME